MPDEAFAYWRKKFRRELLKMRKQGYRDDIKNLRALRSVAEEALASKLPSKYDGDTGAMRSLPSKMALKGLLHDSSKASSFTASLMEGWVNLTSLHAGFQKTLLSALGE
mmetsp:Transcript_24602/g.39488  ORF Transcript_24602/g.39488 Transcript_24602/m.39488 type:complete len:109 (+) Transcript_24602:263-589(+)